MTSSRSSLAHARCSVTACCTCWFPLLLAPCVVLSPRARRRLTHTHAGKSASVLENGGRRRLCSFFSADAAVLLLAEIEALSRCVRAGRAPADLERRFARATPGIRAFRAPQRHLYLHRLGTMPSDQGTHGAGRIPNRALLPTLRALHPP